jgi:hypothetical protein
VSFMAAAPGGLYRSTSAAAAAAAHSELLPTVSMPSAGLHRSTSAAAAAGAISSSSGGLGSRGGAAATQAVLLRKLQAMSAEVEQLKQLIALSN